MIHVNYLLRLPPADGLVGSKDLVDQCIVIGAIDVKVEAISITVTGNDLNQFLGGIIGF